MNPGLYLIMGFWISDPCWFFWTKYLHNEGLKLKEVLISNLRCFGSLWSCLPLLLNWSTEFSGRICRQRRSVFLQNSPSLESSLWIFVCWPIEILSEWWVWLLIHLMTPEWKHWNIGSGKRMIYPYHLAGSSGSSTNKRPGITESEASSLVWFPWTEVFP